MFSLLFRSWSFSLSCTPSRRRTNRPGLEQLEDRCVPAFSIDLAPASDSGVVGDFITNNVLPTFQGMADQTRPDDMQIREDHGAIPTTNFTADANGNWQFTVPNGSALEPDGNYSFVI